MTLVAPPEAAPLVNHLPAGWHGPVHTVEGHVLPVDHPEKWAPPTGWRVIVRPDGRSWTNRIWNDQDLYITSNTSPTTSSAWPYEWGSIVDGWRFTRSGVESSLTAAMVAAESWTLVLD